MEQFSLEKYLANPSRKVVTRDGREARIICTNRRDSNFPIIALIETIPGGGEVTYSYTEDGTYYNTGSTNYDLFFAPEKHEGWINIFKNAFNNYIGQSSIFESKEDAEEDGKKRSAYIATVKVEWEE